MLNIILTLFISLLCLQPLHASNESTVITATQYNHANEAKIKELESIITMNRTGFVGDFLFKLGHLT